MDYPILNKDKCPPIVIIGAGGIVNDAHLPAYKIAGFDVAGIYDIDIEKARATAERWSISTVFENLNDLFMHMHDVVVLDIAVPGSAIARLLEQIPDGSVVLMQKPMGENLEDAKKILEISKNKKLIAGVNFQLRYAPFILEARDMIHKGMIGEPCDIEINVNVYTPWHLWDFLFKAPDVEITYHSIHYIDLVRSFLGNPQSVYAKTIKHPLMSELASVRSNIIMDYGNLKRVNILTNHCHHFGLKHQQSYIKLEGTKGAIKINMGVLCDYPKGIPDSFEYIILGKDKPLEWKTKTIEGTWFPHAFIGSMREMMKVAMDKNYHPDNSVEDCVYTMACVEAALLSSSSGGTTLSI